MVVSKLQRKPITVFSGIEVGSEMFRIGDPVNG